MHSPNHHPSLLLHRHLDHLFFHPFSSSHCLLHLPSLLFSSPCFLIVRRRWMPKAKENTMHAICQSTLVSNSASLWSNPDTAPIIGSNGIARYLNVRIERYICAQLVVAKVKLFLRKKEGKVPSPIKGNNNDANVLLGPCNSLLQNLIVLDTTQMTIFRHMVFRKSNHLKLVQIFQHGFPHSTASSFGWSWSLWSRLVVGIKYLFKILVYTTFLLKALF